MTTALVGNAVNFAGNSRNVVQKARLGYLPAVGNSNVSTHLSIIMCLLISSDSYSFVCFNTISCQHCLLLSCVKVRVVFSSYEILTESYGLQKFNWTSQG